MHFQFCGLDLLQKLHEDLKKIFVEDLKKNSLNEISNGNRVDDELHIFGVDSHKTFM